MIDQVCSATDLESGSVLTAKFRGGISCVSWGYCASVAALPFQKLCCTVALQFIVMCIAEIMIRLCIIPVTMQIT